jgi:hypothetical protein
MMSVQGGTEMELKHWHDAETMTEYLQVSFSAFEQVNTPLDQFDQMVLRTSKSSDTPIADALQDAQLIAFRIEQAKARRSQ